LQYKFYLYKRRYGALWLSFRSRCKWSKWGLEFI